VREALGCSDSEAVDICLGQARQLFHDERLGLVGDDEPLHSLVFEPVMNVAGLVPIHVHYLRQVIEWAKARGASIVADEIFTGLWRTGPFLASCELVDLIDIVVISKGLTNGLAPLSAVWVKDGNGLADSYLPGTHSSTYISNELSLAIALEVLPDLQRLYSRARDTARTGLEQHLLSQFLELGGTSVRQFGCAASVRFDSERLCTAIKERALQDTPAGLIFATTGLAKNKLIMHPAANISEAEIKRAAEVLANAIRATA
jgi:adenosylmethionine-8-amino-7-oxononanoate aminotransferase